MKTLILVFVALLAPLAEAHPVAYQDAIGVMTWNQPFMTDDWITYSFQSDAAIAARYMRFDMPEGRTQFYAPQFRLSREAMEPARRAGECLRLRRLRSDELPEFDHGSRAHGRRGRRRKPEVFWLREV